ncbi:MAG: hypothetical protein ACFFD5_06940 [Candidatus Thorarchaeota archaeon]
MKIGKILLLIGAILTLLSTFFFSFGVTAGTDGRTLISGIGFLFNLPEIFGDVAYWNSFNGGEIALQYTFAIVFILFVFSGVIQLGGLKNKYVAFIGSLIVIAFGIYLVINLTHTPPLDLNRYSSLFWRAPIVDGILPLDIRIIEVNTIPVVYLYLSLGTITLFIGGALGLVGGFLGRKD